MTSNDKKDGSEKSVSAIRKAARETQRAAENEQRLKVETERRAAHRAQMPGILFALQVELVRLESQGVLVDFDVRLRRGSESPDDAPTVKITIADSESTLTLDSEQYEVDSVYAEIEGVRSRLKAEAAERELAKTAKEKLSSNELAAIKKYG